MAAISAPIYRRGIVESCAAMGWLRKRASCRRHGNAETACNRQHLNNSAVCKPTYKRHAHTAGSWPLLTVPYTHLPPPPQFSNPFSRPVKLDVFSNAPFYHHPRARLDRLEIEGIDRSERNVCLSICLFIFIRFSSRSTLSFLILNLTNVGLLNRYVNKRARANV